MTNQQNNSEHFHEDSAAGDKTDPSISNEGGGVQPLSENAVPIHEAAAEQERPVNESLVDKSLTDDTEAKSPLLPEAAVDLAAEPEQNVEVDAGSAPDSEAAVPEWAAELRSAMEALASDFNSKLKYDAKKQEQIDQLYKENSAFRDDMVEKCKKSLVLTVIEQIDDAEKLIAHFDSTKEDGETKDYDSLLVKYEKLLKNYRDVACSFRDMLAERFDVSSWKSAPQTPFDPRRQRSLKTTKTPDIALDKTICETLRFGYQNEKGQVIRPEMVNVFVYNASMTAGQQPMSSETKTPKGADGESVTPKPVEESASNPETDAAN